MSVNNPIPRCQQVSPAPSPFLSPDNVQCSYNGYSRYSRDSFPMPMCGRDHRGRRICASSDGPGKPGAKPDPATLLAGTKPLQGPETRAPRRRFCAFISKTSLRMKITKKTGSNRRGAGLPQMMHTQLKASMEPVWPPIHLNNFRAPQTLAGGPDYIVSSGGKRRLQKKSPG